MYLPMVPLLQIILFRTLPRPQAWFGVGLACVGMLLLSKPDGASLVIGHGAIVTVIGALAMAFEILLISRFANRGDLRRLALLQRSEEHTSELQSLMRISYAVFCLKKK